MNEPPARTQQRIGVTELATGDWLKLTEVTYRDHAGQERTWEAVERRFHRGAVVMIARLLPSSRYLLVQQYRPPANAYALEFPAGLIDSGEPPATTAVRELREETGYTGAVTWLSQACLGSPGISGEAVYLAVMDVDEAATVNQVPETDWDDGEHIETFRVPPADIPAFLADRERRQVIVDSKVAAYFLGQGYRW